MNNPQAIIADIAEEFIGLKEISTNQNPKFQQFWNDTTAPDGMKDRWPYCSAFASFCVDEADRRSDDIKLRRPVGFPGVSQWIAWAESVGSGATAFRYGQNGFYPQRGDVVIYLPKLSHCGIVSQFNQGSDSIHTIEANTSNSEAGNQRDGEGIYARTRKILFCGTFIRIPTIAKKA